MHSDTVRGTGIRGWLAGGVAVVVSAWALLLVATPYLVTGDHAHERGTAVAAGVYLVGGIICHQRSERSFFLWGGQVPVCARCSGLYAAAPLGILIAVGPGRRRTGSRGASGPTTPRWSISTLKAMLLVTAVPTALTVAAEWTGVAEPTNLMRMISALPLGASVAGIVGLAVAGAVDEGA